MYTAIPGGGIFADDETPPPPTLVLTIPPPPPVDADTIPPALPEVLLEPSDVYTELPPRIVKPLPPVTSRSLPASSSFSS